MGEWKELPIDQVKAKSENAIAIGPFGSRMKSDLYVKEGVPVIRGSNLTDSRQLGGDFVFVSPETASSLHSSLVFQNDLVFPHRGAIGQVGIIPRGKHILSTSLMKLTCDPEIADPLFLFYFFRSNKGRHRLLQNASTVGTPGIGQPLSTLRSIRVPVPPLAVQNAIARLLSSLDDKIDLNRRMSATLEEMARALFRSWFVDFDPVRAKAEGRDPGLPADIAALFPDRFEESELGEIPAGWEVRQLGDQVEATRGLSYSGEGLDPSGIPLHNLNSIFEGGGYKHAGIKYFLGEYRDRHLTVAGDVLVANTEQGHNRLLIGYAARLPEGLKSPSIFSHHLYRLRPRTGARLTPSYLVQLLNSPRMHDIVSGFANGTTVNMLPADALEQPWVVLPPEGLVNRYESLNAVSLRRIEKVQNESRTLAALRDSLLPKLISGELRVPEELLERASEAPAG